MGVLYYCGEGLKNEPQKALQWFCNAAEQGHKHAKHLLETTSFALHPTPESLYKKGHYSFQQKDYEEALLWLKSSANMGYGLAQYLTGQLYDYGQGCERNPHLATKYYHRAGNCKQALLNLGILYFLGDGVENDEKKAFLYIQNSANQNETRAYAIMGILHESGKGIRKNFSQAASFYRKGALRGDVFAQFHLGRIYYKGTGVPQDYNEALYWYHKAAEEKYSLAQYNLGKMYLNGQGAFVDVDMAIYWFTRAAKQGNHLAQNYLGKLLDKKGDKNSIYWYKKAAKQGNRQASESLGRIYFTGKTVLKDFTEAAKWYRESTSSFGEKEIEGVNKHHRKAFQWFCRAAEKGNKSGQYHLGMMYRNGQGVSIDIKKAVYWLHLSAEQNYLPSIIALQSIVLIND